jgi:hypothetical protein
VRRGQAAGRIQGVHGGELRRQGGVRWIRGAADGGMVGGGTSDEGPAAARADGGWGTGGRRRLRRDWGAPRGCGQRETNDTDGPDQRRTTVKIDLRQNGWEAGYPYVLNK